MYVCMYVCICLPCGDSVILLVSVITEEDNNNGDCIALLTPIVTGPNEDTVAASCTVWVWCDPVNWALLIPIVVWTLDDDDDDVTVGADWEESAPKFSTHVIN